jgi:hypothetical protein
LKGSWQKVIRVENLSKNFQGLSVLKDVNVTINTDEEFTEETDTEAVEEQADESPAEENTAKEEKGEKSAKNQKSNHKK